MNNGKISRPFADVPRDKLEHALVGVLAFAFVRSVLLASGVGVGVSLACAFTAVYVLGWGIEFYQRRTGSGVFDKKDAMWTHIGGAFGLFASLPVEMIYE